MIADRLVTLFFVERLFRTVKRLTQKQDIGNENNTANDGAQIKNPAPTEVLCNVAANQGCKGRSDNGTT